MLGVRGLMECDAGRREIRVNVEIPEGAELAAPLEEGCIWRQARGSAVEVVGVAQQWYDELDNLAFSKLGLKPNNQDAEVEENISDISSQGGNTVHIDCTVNISPGTSEVLINAVLYFKLTDKNGSCSNQHDIRTVEMILDISDHHRRQTRGADGCIHALLESHINPRDLIFMKSLLLRISVARQYLRMQALLGLNCKKPNQRKTTWNATDVGALFCLVITTASTYLNSCDQNSRSRIYLLELVNPELYFTPSGPRQEFSNLHIHPALVLLAWSQGTPLLSGTQGDCLLLHEGIIFHTQRQHNLRPFPSTVHWRVTYEETNNIHGVGREISHVDRATDAEPPNSNQLGYFRENTGKQRRKNR
ncbi:hypothetical protein ACLOJK_007999 [Asimina triloba]